MQWLLNAGASHNTSTRGINISIGTDIVQFAAMAMRYAEGAEIVKLILGKDIVHVNKPNNAGVTLPQLALSIGSYSLLNVVLATGADVSFLLNRSHALTNL